MGKTGGGRGTNQYQVHGVSQASSQDAAVLDGLAEAPDADDPARRIVSLVAGSAPVATRTFVPIADPGCYSKKRVARDAAAELCDNGMWATEAFRAEEGGWGVLILPWA